MAGKKGPGRFLTAVLLLGVWAGSGCLFQQAMRYSDFITPTPIAPTDTLVIGFLGGRQPYDNAKEGTRRLALKLRGMALPGVHVETAENARRELALELVERAFDRDGDGQLNEQERQGARIVVYGQSFGGAAVVKLARALDERAIPVLLTVQVDSVGRGDELIPPNVRQAANLHQQDGLVIRGEKEIRAEDPARTEILGNFQFSYKSREVDMSGVKWHKRVFRNAHAKMDRDPEVWAKVEELILSVVGHKEAEAQKE